MGFSVKLCVNKAELNQRHVQKLRVGALTEVSEDTLQTD